jgi:hypothetical protein
MHYAIVSNIPNCSTKFCNSFHNTHMGARILRNRGTPRIFIGGGGGADTEARFNLFLTVL